MEVWKDIPGFEGIYQASDCGQIRSIDGKCTYTEHHGTRHWKGRILKMKGHASTGGYRVTLWKDGKPQGWLVHRLVALAFLGIPKEGMTVNHIDGDRSNNRVENIEWLTLEDNIKHGHANGLYKSTRQPVSLEREGERYDFLSLSEVDRFLQRCAGYTSAKRAKKKTKVRSKEGREYTFVEE